MFCKYCGNRLETPEKPCSHCGREQGPLSATNGFFGVLEYTEPRPVIHSENTNPIKAEYPKVENVKTSPKITLKKNSEKVNRDLISVITSVICAVVIVIAAVVCTGIVGKKIDELQETQQELLQEIQAVESSTESNRKSVESLAKQIEDLQQEQEKQSETLKKTQIRLIATPSPSPQPTVTPEENEPKISEESSAEDFAQEGKQSTEFNVATSTPKPMTGEE